MNIPRECHCSHGHRRCDCLAQVLRFSESLGWTHDVAAPVAHRIQPNHTGNSLFASSSHSSLYDPSEYIPSGNASSEHGWTLPYLEPEVDSSTSVVSGPGQYPAVFEPAWTEAESQARSVAAGMDVMRQGSSRLQNILNLEMSATLPESPYRRNVLSGIAASNSQIQIPINSGMHSASSFANRKASSGFYQGQHAEKSDSTHASSRYQAGRWSGVQSVDSPGDNTARSYSTNTVEGLTNFVADPSEPLSTAPTLQPDKIVSRVGSVPYWCTVCWEQCSSKTWRRHEETQHCPQKLWKCATHQLVLSRSDRDVIECPLCDDMHTSQAEFEVEHRTKNCMLKQQRGSNFVRKDHVVQHLKQVHKVTKKLSDPEIKEMMRLYHPDGPENLICGFCGQKLKDWDDRMTHLPPHFREGLNKSDWKGN